MRTELAILHKKLDRTMIYAAHDQIEAMTMADRIVIMDNGIVQQIGSPRDVYNHPANRFVAGFIGSPSMDFLAAELTGTDSIRVQGDGFDLPLNSWLQAETRSRTGRRVIVGTRPEHFASHGIHATTPSEFAPVHLTVEVADYIGSSQYLAARIGGVPVTASIEAGPDSETLQTGECLFNSDRMYLFDPETGETIA